MPLPKFETLSDWNNFMKGRMVLIINKDHEWYGEECSFVEMVGKHEVIKHPSNKSGKEIRMKATTKFGTELLLDGKDLFIIDKKIPQQPDKN